MRVLVTGASGRIGQHFARAVSDDDLQLELTDRCDAAATGFDRAVTRLDVTDADACARAVEPVDAVLHLAADPSPEADFHSSVLPVNMIGTYNLVTSAVAVGVRRFVFASSAQAVAGYPLDHQVRERDAPRPINDYGVGKAFGEALCAAASARSSTTFVAVRIGNYAAQPPSAQESLRLRMAWLSPRDADQLLGLALTVAIDDFKIAHGVSNNAAKQLSLYETRAVFGYRPHDDAFADDPLL